MRRRLRELRSATHVVESYWPGVNHRDLADADRRLRTAAAREAVAGIDVDYRGSLLLTLDETVISVFVSGSPEAIQRTCQAAGLPFERVVPGLAVGAVFGLGESAVHGRDQRRGAPRAE